MERHMTYSEALTLATLSKMPVIHLDGLNLSEKSLLWYLSVYDCFNLYQAIFNKQVFIDASFMLVQSIDGTNSNENIKYRRYEIGELHSLDHFSSRLL